MRIIAGEKRGLRLQTLEGEEARPTLERVKEAMFSAIQFALPGAKVLDLFAGSGQLGLEALSRGAAACVFVEESREGAALVRQNAQHVELFKQSSVITMDASAFLKGTKEKFDIVFLDPPYRKNHFPLILEQLAEVLAPGAVVLCETETGVDMPQQIAGLALQKQHRYGTVVVTRYKNAAE